MKMECMWRNCRKRQLASTSKAYDVTDTRNTNKIQFFQPDNNSKKKYVKYQYKCQLNSGRIFYSVILNLQKMNE